MFNNILKRINPWAAPQTESSSIDDSFTNNHKHVDQFFDVASKKYEFINYKLEKVNDIWQDTRSLKTALIQIEQYYKSNVLETQTGKIKDEVTTHTKDLLRTLVGGSVLEEVVNMYTALNAIKEMHSIIDKHETLIRKAVKGEILNIIGNIEGDLNSAVNLSTISEYEELGSALTDNAPSIDPQNYYQPQQGYGKLSKEMKTRDQILEENHESIFDKAGPSIDNQDVEMRDDAADDAVVMGDPDRGPSIYQPPQLAPLVAGETETVIPQVDAPAYSPYTRDILADALIDGNETARSHTLTAIVGKLDRLEKLAVLEAKRTGTSAAHAYESVYLSQEAQKMYNDSPFYQQQKRQYIRFNGRRMNQIDEKYHDRIFLESHRRRYNRGYRDFQQRWNDTITPDEEVKHGPNATDLQKAAGHGIDSYSKAQFKKLGRMHEEKFASKFKSQVADVESISHSVGSKLVEKIKNPYFGRISLNGWELYETGVVPSSNLTADQFIDSHQSTNIAEAIEESRKNASNLLNNTSIENYTNSTDNFQRFIDYCDVQVTEMKTQEMMSSKYRQFNVNLNQTNMKKQEANSQLITNDTLEKIRQIKTMTLGDLEIAKYAQLKTEDKKKSTLYGQTTQDDFLNSQEAIYETAKAKRKQDLLVQAGREKAQEQLTTYLSGGNNDPRIGWYIKNVASNSRQADMVSGIKTEGYSMSGPEFDLFGGLDDDDYMRKNRLPPLAQATIIKEMLGNQNNFSINDSVDTNGNLEKAIYDEFSFTGNSQIEKTLQSFGTQSVYMTKTEARRDVDGNNFLSNSFYFDTGFLALTAKMGNSRNITTASYGDYVRRTTKHLRSIATQEIRQRNPQEAGFLETQLSAIDVQGVDKGGYAQSIMLANDYLNSVGSSLSRELSNADTLDLVNNEKEALEEGTRQTDVQKQLNEQNESRFVQALDNKQEAIERSYQNDNAEVEDDIAAPAAVEAQQQEEKMPTDTTAEPMEESELKEASATGLKRRGGKMKQMEGVSRNYTPPETQKISTHDKQTPRLMANIILENYQKIKTRYNFINAPKGYPLALSIELGGDLIISTLTSLKKIWVKKENAWMISQAIKLAAMEIGFGPAKTIGLQVLMLKITEDDNDLANVKEAKRLYDRTEFLTKYEKALEARGLLMPVPQKNPDVNNTQPNQYPVAIGDNGNNFLQNIKSRNAVKREKEMAGEIMGRLLTSTDRAISVINATDMPLAAKQKFIKTANIILYGNSLPTEYFQALANLDVNNRGNGNALERALVSLAHSGASDNKGAMASDLDDALTRIYPRLDLNKDWALLVEKHMRDDLKKGIEKNPRSIWAPIIPETNDEIATKKFFRQPDQYDYPGMRTGRRDQDDDDRSPPRKGKKPPPPAFDFGTKSRVSRPVSTITETREAPEPEKRGRKAPLSMLENELDLVTARISATLALATPTQTTRPESETLDVARNTFERHSVKWWLRHKEMYPKIEMGFFNDGINAARKREREMADTGPAPFRGLKAPAVSEVREEEMPTEDEKTNLVSMEETEEPETATAAATPTETVRRPEYRETGTAMASTATSDTGTDPDPVKDWQQMYNDQSRARTNDLVRSKADLDDVVKELTSLKATVGASSGTYESKVSELRELENELKIAKRGLERLEDERKKAAIVTKQELDDKQNQIFALQKQLPEIQLSNKEMNTALLGQLFATQGLKDEIKKRDLTIADKEQIIVDANSAIDKATKDKEAAFIEAKRLSSQLTDSAAIDSAKAATIQQMEDKLMTYQTQRTLDQGKIDNLNKELNDNTVVKQRIIKAEELTTRLKDILKKTEADKQLLQDKADRSDEIPKYQAQLDAATLKINDLHTQLAAASIDKHKQADEYDRYKKDLQTRTDAAIEKMNIERKNYNDLFLEKSKMVETLLSDATKKIKPAMVSSITDTDDLPREITRNISTIKSKMTATKAAITEILSTTDKSIGEFATKHPDVLGDAAKKYVKRSGDDLKSYESMIKDDEPREFVTDSRTGLTGPVIRERSKSRKRLAEADTPPGDRNIMEKLSKIPTGTRAKIHTSAFAVKSGDNDLSSSHEINVPIHLSDNIKAISSSSLLADPMTMNVGTPLATSSGATTTGLKRCCTDGKCSGCQAMASAVRSKKAVGTINASEVASKDKALGIPKVINADKVALGHTTLDSGFGASGSDAKLSNVIAASGQISGAKALAMASDMLKTTEVGMSSSAPAPVSTITGLAPGGDDKTDDGNPNTKDQYDTPIKRKQADLNPINSETTDNVEREIQPFQKLAKAVSVNDLLENRDKVIQNQLAAIKATATSSNALDAASKLTAIRQSVSGIPVKTQSMANLASGYSSADYKVASILKANALDPKGVSGLPSMEQLEARRRNEYERFIAGKHLNDFAWGRQMDRLEGRDWFNTGGNTIMFGDSIIDVERPMPEPVNFMESTMDFKKRVGTELTDTRYPDLSREARLVRQRIPQIIDAGYADEAKARLVNAYKTALTLNRSNRKVLSPREAEKEYNEIRVTISLLDAVKQKKKGKQKLNYAKLLGDGISSKSLRCKTCKNDNHDQLYQSPKEMICKGCTGRGMYSDRTAIDSKSPMTPIRKIPKFQSMLNFMESAGRKLKESARPAWEKYKETVPRNLMRGDIEKQLISKHITYGKPNQHLANITATGIAMATHKYNDQSEVPHQLMANIYSGLTKLSKPNNINSKRIDVGRLNRFSDIQDYIKKDAYGLLKRIAPK